jgi:uncharacterized protein (TIGR02271 family)
MALDLVGVFDDPRKADLACERIKQLDIDEKHVRNHSHDSDQAGMSSGDSGEHRGFLARLFGGGDSHDEQSGHIAEAARRGSSVVSVHLENEEKAARVEQILEEAGAVDINDRVETWKTSGYTGHDPNAAAYTPEQIARERETLEVLQEELRVGKRQVQAGGVRVHRRVIETPVNEQVSLREEHAVVDRRPVDRAASAEDLRAFDAGDRDIEIRESREEAVVDKRARVVEEVSIGKEASEHTETINETVRRTDVDVEQIDPAQANAMNRKGGGSMQPRTPR